jgi:ketosteroid isomerase-like protein
MATAHGDADRTLRAALDEFVRHFNARDTARRVEAFYTADAQLLPPNHPPVRGRAAIRDFFQAFLDAGAGDLAAETVEVGAAGDLAYRTGR